MRILHGILSGKMAGGQKVCLDLIHDQIQRGHEILLSSPSNGLMISSCPEQVAVSFHSVERVTRPWVLLKLVYFLYRSRPDLIHTHVTVSGNILWRLAGWLTGIPVINHIHINNNFRSNSFSGKIALWMDNFTSHSTALFIAVSQQIADELIKQGYPSNRIVIIQNGVMVEEDISNIRSGNQGEPIIGCVARLCQTKDQAALVRAFGEVCSKFETAQLWLIGEDQETGGSYREHLEHLVSDHKLEESVHFLGHREDVLELMRKMTMLVLPSLDEGLPLVLLEAMAQGLPVIATRVGGVTELVSDGVDGILIDPGDDKSLISAIEKILEDRRKAGIMGEAGRNKVADKFNLELVLSEVNNVYQKVLTET